MKIEWAKKDVPLTPAMKERVQARAEGLQNKHPDEPISLRVSLTQNKGKRKPWTYRLKGIMQVNGMTIKAESRRVDYYEAADDMMDILLHNFLKEKDKREKQNRNARRLFKEELNPPFECEEEFA